MFFNTTTKILLAIAIVLILIYFIYNSKSSKIQNKGSVEQNATIKTTKENTLPVNEDVFATARTTKVAREDHSRALDHKDYTPPLSMDEISCSKMKGRNTSKGKYVNSSYAAGIRGQLGENNNLNKQFSSTNNILANGSSGSNNNFHGVDETSANYAIFKSTGPATCGSNQNCTPEDLFNINNYLPLPGEVNDDWFEVIPEPISVKNRHLINISKPIGINTIGTSMKNASHDIRGTPACPKTVVAPWLQSSIEPDINIKPLC